MSSIDPSMTGFNSILLKGQEQSETAKLEQMRKQFLHPEGTDQKKLKQAAQDFEAVFLNQMLDMMDKTIDRKDSFLSGGTGEDYWRGMMNQEVAKSMATRPGGSGFGLAENIYRQMAAQLKPENTGETGSMNEVSG